MSYTRLTSLSRQNTIFTHSRALWTIFINKGKFDSITLLSLISSLSLLLFLLPSSSFLLFHPYLHIDSISTRQQVFTSAGISQQRRYPVADSHLTSGKKMARQAEVVRETASRSLDGSLSHDLKRGY